MSELPTPWLTSTVIPLFKKGKRCSVSNYRPISLTSSCCKIMESIISDALSHYLLTNNLLSNHQHGFIKNRSTLTNLLSSVRLWHSSLNLKKSTDIIYIDFAKAFDTVSHPKLIHKLKSYGILGKLLLWISAWLSGRSQSVKLGKLYSKLLTVLSGVFQGSVLGPLLFLLFINDLIDIIPPEVHPTLFADDLKIFSDQTPVPNLSDPGYVSSTLLQNALNSVYSWSLLWQLHISIPKCTILSISNAKSPKPRLYFIHSDKLPQVSSYSDLGVSIDEKLTFSNHILSITKTAYSKSFLLSRCFLSKNPTLLKSAFSTYVRPILEYASPIWSPHLDKDIVLLEKVQRRFSKSIPAYRHLPYAARLQCLSLQSLSLRRIHIDLCTCYRIVHGLSSLESSLFFTRRHSITRGHPLSLVKPPVRLNSTKFSFQSRIIDTWNSLPLAVVTAISLSSFKLKLKCINLED